jgi:hypothetical protein
VRRLAAAIFCTIGLWGVGLWGVGGAAQAGRVARLDPRWVGYRGGALPDDVVTGGFEHGHDFPVCRVHRFDMRIPGKLLAGNCNFGFAGRGYVEPPPYEVLTGARHPGVDFWRHSRPVDPADTVQAGSGSEGPVAVCVGHRSDGTDHPGKLFRGSCSFEYGGHEESVGDFDWLARQVYVAR